MVSNEQRMPMENAVTRDIVERTLMKITAETGMRARVIKWGPRLDPQAKIRLDALIEIKGGQQRYRFAAEAKNVDRFEILHQIRAFWPKEEKPRLLLVAPYITPKIAERCREIEMYFADTAGNMYLRGPGLHIYVLGKLKPPELHLAEIGRTINPAGLRVVFALLCQPKLLNATYREIAACARIALGTVGPVMKDLEKRKHITPGLATRRRFLQPHRLLEEWVGVYPTVLRPKLNIRRFRAQQHKWTADLDLTPYKAQWGGEVAANRLVDYLEPQTATIYAPQLPRQLIVDQKLRADINGDVEVLDLFWNFQAATQLQDVVPAILAYADLMATTDGRNIEAAKMIYERYIGPTFASQT
jgi:hypothetical protein